MTFNNEKYSLFVSEFSRVLATIIVLFGFFLFSPYTFLELRKSFVDFMNGNLSQIPGEKPTIIDWEDHLSTIFTEVRLKKFIEVRGADAGNWRRTCALPAFWVGILYDNEVLNKALQICKKWNYEDVERLSLNVAKKGLNASINNYEVKELAEEFINLSIIGLKKRELLDLKGNDETQYLNVLKEIIKSKKTPAEKLLEDFEKKWNKNITKLIKEMSY